MCSKMLARLPTQEKTVGHSFLPVDCYALDKRHFGKGCSKCWKKACCVVVDKKTVSHFHCLWFRVTYALPSSFRERRVDISLWKIECVRFSKIMLTGIMLWERACFEGAVAHLAIFVLRGLVSRCSVLKCFVLRGIVLRSFVLRAAFQRLGFNRFIVTCVV